MKRLLITGVAALTLMAGATAAQAAPTPTPTPEASESAEPEPSSTRSVDPETAAACEKSRTTVTDGISAFTTELDKANTAATSGDLAGAEESVKAAGTELMDLSTDLKKDVEDVENPELASALTDVADELDNLGSSLDSLTALQNFDTTRLEELSDRVSEICGE
jgi:ABC-type transport system substrate-binding protein